MNNKSETLKTEDSGLSPVSMTTRLLPNEPGDRMCLKCNRLFPSRSAANRICRKCSQVNASIRISNAFIARERGEKRLNGNLLETHDAYVMTFH